MPPYKQMGTIPPKRHTVFRDKDGELYREEVFGTEGFEGVQSILYHIHPPTAVTGLKGKRDVAPEQWSPSEHRHHHLQAGKVETTGDAIEARRVLMFSATCRVSVCNPTEPTEAFFRNGGADELWFVRQGEGKIDTVFGEIYYKEGDYIHIPRGTTYRFRRGQGHRFLLIESHEPITFPGKYVNQWGQFMEHAPYCERDLHGPRKLEPVDEQGPFELQLKMGDEISTYELQFHPFDVVGWDGCNYPFTFNISDFEPITGRIHQPPPVHATFVGKDFEVISWVPRKVDYHPDSIPAPYYHSNIDTDEAIFYVEGSFASREGIGEGSITLHRRGVHHGPQPGRYEGSIGVEEVEETAVMLEVGSPFKMTRYAKQVDDGDYPLSWEE